MTVPFFFLLRPEQLGGELGEKLHSVQGVLMTVIVGSGHRRLSASSRRTLSVMWGHRPEATAAAEKALQKGLEQNLETLVLASFFVEWLVRRKEEERAGKLRKSMLASLVKLVVSSKAKTDGVFLKVQR